MFLACNEKGYFTCGSSDQYKKMFELVNQCADVHDIALVIWICSDNKELETIEKELKILAEIK